MFETIRLCCIGDPAVGKTSVLSTLVNERANQAYEPTTFNTFMHCLCIDQQMVDLIIWDTSGSEIHGGLGTLVFPGTDCFIVMYAVDSPVSLSRAETHWIPTIRKNRSDATIVLVGNKTDLPAHVHQVSADDAKRVVTRLRLSAWFECCITDEQGIQRAFESIVDLAMRCTVTDKLMNKRKLRTGCGCTIA